MAVDGTAQRAELMQRLNLAADKNSQAAVAESPRPEQTLHPSALAGLLQRTAALGVPDQLRSCHTTKVDGYVLEGHVPATDVERLLSERPEARGLAVPGMPTGSPGMEMPGVSPDSYEVILFDDNKSQVFSRY